MPNPKAMPILASAPLLASIESEPTNTSMNVPRNSAPYFCQLFM